MIGRLKFMKEDIFVKTQANTSLMAWEPFYDCVGILFDLYASEIDDEHPEWKTNWVAGLALLRTIGHVLQKVDAKSSPKHAEEIERLWKYWKLRRRENWIFWDFIEEERNNILKAYQFGVAVEKESLVHQKSGYDGIQLFREATYWWRSQLEKLEKRVH